MSYSNASPANAAYLASVTGLDPSVAMAWLRLEGQSVPNPTNPLNIRNSPLATGRTPGGGFATFASPQAGLDAAARLINNASFYSGIRAAIRGGDPQAQARAIEASPWAAGHYGYGGIERALGLTPAPRPSGKAAPAKAPNAVPVAPKRSSLSGTIALAAIALAVVLLILGG